jgi:hypothetical protein
MHNYNIVPHGSRDLLVHGSYQSGTALVDFTDPMNTYEIAWMDPVPLDPPSTDSPGGRATFRGGDWASYWYNGYIYGNDSGRGFDVMLLSDPVRAGARRLSRLNPQTQESSL